MGDAGGVFGHCPELSGVRVFLPDYLLDDEEELGQVGPGDIVTNPLELLGGRDWKPAGIEPTGISRLADGRSRITARTVPTRAGFYLVCHSAWIHVYTGETSAVDGEQPVWLAPARTPRRAARVTCEGVLAPALWSGALEDYAGREGGGPDGELPPEVGWLVTEVERIDDSTWATLDAVSGTHAEPHLRLVATAG